MRVYAKEGGKIGQATRIVSHLVSVGEVLVLEGIRIPKEVNSYFNYNEIKTEFSGLILCPRSS
jgi:hypothetical protein